MSETREQLYSDTTNGYHQPALNGSQEAVKVPPSGKISYEEFLDWADEDTHAEWVDGEIIIMPSPASFKHETIGDFLVALLNAYSAIYDSGTAVSAPFQMKLPDSGPGREPDVIFVKNEHLDRIRHTFLDGVADIAVEIVSPESVVRDRETKFTEYAAAGVPEYWLIDPTENQAIFYRLDENRQYQAASLDNEGRYFSQVLPGFWLKPAWLWLEPLPTIPAAMNKIAGRAYEEFLTREFQREL